MTRLGADIEGRRQSQYVPIPECGMIAGMIVGIADQDSDYLVSWAFFPCTRSYALQNGQMPCSTLFTKV
jgi:hypothetical protein